MARRGLFIFFRQASSRFLRLHKSQAHDSTQRKSIWVSAISSRRHTTGSSRALTGRAPSYVPAIASRPLPPSPHLASSHAVSLHEPDPLFFFFSVVHFTNRSRVLGGRHAHGRMLTHPLFCFHLSSPLFRTSCARRVSSWAPSSSCALAATLWPSNHILGLWWLVGGGVMWEEE